MKEQKCRVERKKTNFFFLVCGHFMSDKRVLRETVRSSFEERKKWGREG